MMASITAGWLVKHRREVARGIVAIALAVVLVVPTVAARAGTAEGNQPVSRTAKLTDEPPLANPSLNLDTQRMLGPLPGVPIPTQGRSLNDSLSVSPDYGSEKPWQQFYRAGDALRPDKQTVVATVQGHDIYLSEIADALASLPEELRAQPFQYLYPKLLEAAIDKRALIIKAQEAHLDNDVGVRRRMAAAADSALAKELLDQAIAQKITEAAISARYRERYANRTAAEEAHIRVVVLDTEATAREALSALAAGADFATLARQKSVDPSGPTGGDLGYMRREQLRPDQAAIVFSLPAGTVATTPLRDQHGWTIFKVEDRRSVPLPTLQQTRFAIRKELIQEVARDEIDRARRDVIIRAYNIDGTALTPLSQDDLDQGVRVESRER